MLSCKKFDNKFMLKTDRQNFCTMDKHTLIVKLLVINKVIRRISSMAETQLSQCNSSVKGHLELGSVCRWPQNAASTHGCMDVLRNPRNSSFSVMEYVA